jgi:hypothetical protein
MSRVIAGIGAAALTVPLALGLGTLAFAFIPLLRDGVQPMLLFMVSANGVGGVFFFLVLFGTPVAAVISTLAYACFARRLRREPPISRWWPVGVGALLGTVLFPMIWVRSVPDSLFLRYFGPVVLGALSGAAAATAFWAVAGRRARRGLLPN